MDAIHTSEIPAKGVLIKVVQSSDSSAAKKKSTTPQQSHGPRRRASTLGVISELPNQQDPTCQKPKSLGAKNLVENQSRSRMSSSSSTSSMDGSPAPVVAGHVKAFGDLADKTLFRIEDRVVHHPADPATSTCYMRDVQYRMASDMCYLVPIASNIPLKLAAMLGGRGLNIYSAVLETQTYIQALTKCQDNNTQGTIDTLKILVVCNDEFSMLAVQLIHKIIVIDSHQNNVLVALATLRDEGMMWYMKNMPQVKLVQWNGDAYDQILVERTRDACKGEVDIVIGCIGLGAPLQRSFKCLKKGGIAFVTEDVNEKVWKPLKKMADSQCKELKMVERTNPGDLKSLLDLVAAEQVQPAFLSEEPTLPLQSGLNGMRRKARSLSSRATRETMLAE